jgi:mono/diheme cytochrome c family protein
VKRRLVLTVALAAAACGSQGIDVPEEYRPAAELFVQRCSGCHTLSAVGAQGASTNVRTREYKDGPNFDVRHVTKNCALFAIRNGGFSSGPMPQNIITGERAEAVAAFLAEFSGRDAPDVVGPSTGASDSPA